MKLFLNTCEKKAKEGAGMIMEEGYDHRETTLAMFRSKPRSSYIYNEFEKKTALNHSNSFRKPVEWEDRPKDTWLEVRAFSQRKHGINRYNPMRVFNNVCIGSITCIPINISITLWKIAYTLEALYVYMLPTIDWSGHSPRIIDENSILISVLTCNESIRALYKNDKSILVVYTPSCTHTGYKHNILRLHAAPAFHMVIVVKERHNDETPLFLYGFTDEYKPRSIRIKNSEGRAIKKKNWRRCKSEMLLDKNIQRYRKALRPKLDDNDSEE